MCIESVAGGRNCKCRGPEVCVWHGRKAQRGMAQDRTNGDREWQNAKGGREQGAIPDFLSVHERMLGFVTCVFPLDD